jgi:hypothetical protein
VAALAGDLPIAFRRLDTLRYGICAIIAMIHDVPYR